MFRDIVGEKMRPLDARSRNCVARTVLGVVAIVFALSTFAFGSTGAAASEVCARSFCVKTRIERKFLRVDFRAKHKNITHVNIRSRSLPYFVTFGVPDQIERPPAGAFSLNPAARGGVVRYQMQACNRGKGLSKSSCANWVHFVHRM